MLRHVMHSAPILPACIDGTPCGGISLNSECFLQIMLMESLRKGRSMTW